MPAEAGIQNALIFLGSRLRPRLRGGRYFAGTAITWLFSASFQQGFRGARHAANSMVDPSAPVTPVPLPVPLDPSALTVCLSPGLQCLP